MEWTESATMALVDEWQKYPCLYDVKSDDYHNRVLKSTAMQTIATILKTTGYRRSPPICTLLDAILLQLVAVDILSSLVKLRCARFAVQLSCAAKRAQLVSRLTWALCPLHSFTKVLNTAIDLIPRPTLLLCDM